MPKVNHALNDGGTTKKTMVLAEFALKNDPLYIQAMKNMWEDIGLPFDYAVTPVKINDNRYLSLRFFKFGGTEIPLARYDNGIKPNTKVSLNDIIEYGIFTYTCQIKNIKAIQFWQEGEFSCISDIYKKSEIWDFMFDPEDIDGSPKSEDQIKEWLRFPEIL